MCANEDITFLTLNKEERDALLTLYPLLQQALAKCNCPDFKDIDKALGSRINKLKADVPPNTAK